MEEVTDPAVLAQLNSTSVPPAQEVTDPKLLDALNSTQSPVESAARGALRNFPLAQQAVATAAPVLNKIGLADKPDYSGEMQHLTEAAEQGKDQNKKSYYTGAGIGAIAPMAVPFLGEAGAAAGAAMDASPIIANAALGAAQGLSDTNLTRDPAKILRDAAPGAVIGGGLGAVGKALGAIAPSAEEAGAASAAHGFGARARGSANVAGKDPEAFWNEIGKWANETTTPDGKPIVALANRPGKMLAAINDIHDAAGKEIGDILDKISPGASLPKASLTQDLYPIADSLETLAPAKHADVMGVINKINKLSDEGKLDLTALNKIKSFVGEETKNNPVMKQVYSALSESVNNTIDEYGRIIGNTADREAFDLARTNYKNTSRLIPILGKFEGRELAQGPLGNSGLLGMIGGAGALAAGHPVGAAATMAGSAIGRPLVNMLGRNAALKMVPAMPAVAAAGRGLSKAAQLELTNALESKFGKGK